MPRSARINLDQGLFHILCRGNNKQVVFHDESDYSYYKFAIRKLRGEHPLKLYHWCLMSTHVHLVVETCSDTRLSRMIKRLNLMYYAYYKNKYPYAGHFWQDRFKSLLVDTDNYLLACGLYVERNPVRAGMVRLAEEYQHSSYCFHGYGRDDGLTDATPLYETLGRIKNERQRVYRALTLDVQMGVSSALFNQRFFGTDGFVKNMEIRFGVPNVRLARGRPRKDEK